MKTLSQILKNELSENTDVLKKDKDVIASCIDDTQHNWKSLLKYLSKYPDYKTMLNDAQKIEKTIEQFARKISSEIF